MTKAGAKRSVFKLLYFQVLLAMVVGVCLGLAYPDFGAALKPLGDGFIKLVKMIIAPVIFCTVVTGIGGMSNLKAAGTVSAKALGYFLVVSSLALVVGLIVANVVRPGDGLHIDPAALDTGTVSNYVANRAGPGIAGFLLHIIPDTTVGAFASGEILQVLLCSVLFGLALSAIGESGRGVYELIAQLSRVVFGIVHLIMKAAPIGAFGAMAFTIGKFGFGSLANLALLIGCFYLTALLFVLGVLGLVARAAGFSVLRLIRYIKEELLLVLGTSSSESAFPSLIEKLENAGVARPVVGLVLPMGYSFNLDGTNIYMTMAALFIAQATDTPLTLADQLLLLGVAMISSKGAAGVTGSGFVTLAATLAVVPSVPVAGIALILGIDRFMSEGRALTNFVGNAVATIVVGCWQGSVDRKKLQAALAGSPSRGD